MLLTKTSLSAAIFSFALFAQTPGNNSVNEPENVIVDSRGLSIDLKWTTNKNDASALTDVDLDLDVLVSGVEIRSSYNKSDFEHLDLTSPLADGTYVIQISPFEIYKKGSYTVSITGATSGKNFDASGEIKKGIQNSFNVLKVVKSGDQFIITQI
jgi:hypothetical protein